MNETSELYERRCRMLLRSYPPSYLTVRGAELLDTMLEAAEPGRSRPTLHESWDVIRGGLTARQRARPPLRLWLAYRGNLNADLSTWRWWVRDDILGRRYPLRHATAHWLVSLPWWLVLIRDPGSSGDDLPSWGPSLEQIKGAGLLLFCLLWPLFVYRFSRRDHRERQLAKYGFDPDGTPLPDYRGPGDYQGHAWSSWRDAILQPRYAMRRASLVILGWLAIVGIAWFLVATDLTFAEVNRFMGPITGLTALLWLLLVCRYNRRGHRERLLARYGFGPDGRPLPVPLRPPGAMPGPETPQRL